MKTELLGPSKKSVDELLKLQKQYKNESVSMSISAAERKQRVEEIQRIALNPKSGIVDLES